MMTEGRIIFGYHCSIAFLKYNAVLISLASYNLSCFRYTHFNPSVSVAITTSKNWFSDVLFNHVI